MNIFNIFYFIIFNSVILTFVIGDQKYVPHPFCLLPIDGGTYSGKISVIRFGYSNAYGRCVIFEYTGAGGTRNNFFDPKTCIDLCEHLLN